MSTLKDFNLMIRGTRTQEYLADALGARKEEFVANLTTLVANDKGLQACDPVTTMYAAMTATTLNLPLDKNLGQAYVIPFKNGRAGTTEAQFQIGWKGLVTLAQRSGTIRTLNADVVYEGELISFNKLTGEPDLSGERTSDEVIGYFAHVELLNGFRKTVYMTKAEAEAHGKRYSQTYRSSSDYIRKNSKWTTDFDAMALKTVVKQLINKWVPKDTRMQMAISADQSIQREFGEYRYSDNESAKDRLSEVAAEAVEAVEVTEDATTSETPAEGSDKQEEQQQSLFSE